MKVLGEEEDQEEEENEDGILRRTKCCEQAIESAKKHARRARAMKKKVESSERTGARKTHQIESVRGRGEAATGALIPVKSSLEEEISRIRDESEAAMRRIKDLRCELREKQKRNKGKKKRTRRNRWCCPSKKVCADAGAGAREKNWTRRQRFCEEKRRDWRR